MLILVLVLVLKDALRTIFEVLVLVLESGPRPCPCPYGLVLVLFLSVGPYQAFLSKFLKWFTTWNKLNRNTSMEFALTYLSCPEHQLTRVFAADQRSVPDELSLTTLANSIDSPSSKTCLAECSAVQQQLRQWSEFFAKWTDYSTSSCSHDWPITVWLAQLVKALATPTHVRSCVQEVRVRSPERTSLTLASIPPG